MGICVSSTAISSVPAATAKLILMDGSIQEFFEGMRSREILEEYPSHFICNSDGLYVGRNISQVLRDDDQLQIGQLYFLLPQRKLQFVLTDSDMASFLFRINSAWVSSQKNKRQSRRLSCGFGKTQTQVQPLFDIRNQHDEYAEEYSSSSARRPSIQISNPRGRGRIQWQSKLETIAETV
jgi:hypothetical protein